MCDVLGFPSSVRVVFVPAPLLMGGGPAFTGPYSSDIPGGLHIGRGLVRTDGH